MKQSNLDGTSINIYRKRIIPDECILLKNDTILEATDEYIITKWETLKPRRDFHHGYSCYYLKEGYKCPDCNRSARGCCDIPRRVYQSA